MTNAVALRSVEPLPSAGWRIAAMTVRVFAGLVLAAITVIGLAPSDVVPGDPVAVVAGGFAPPSAALPLGADALGRSVFAQVLSGTATTLVAAASAWLLALGGGLAWGLMAAGLGSAARAAMVPMLAASSIPAVILALVLALAFPGGSWAALAICAGLAAMPRYARASFDLMTATLSETYAETSASAGTPPERVARRRVLRKAFSGALVPFEARLSGMILAVATIGFLMAYPVAPHFEWGALVAANQQHFATAWWTVAGPAGAVTGAALLAWALQPAAWEPTHERA